jgi:hypothetical protein
MGVGAQVRAEQARVRAEEAGVSMFQRLKGVEWVVSLSRALKAPSPHVSTRYPGHITGETGLARAAVREPRPGSPSTDVLSIATCSGYVCRVVLEKYWLASF